MAYRARMLAGLTAFVVGAIIAGSIRVAVAEKQGGTGELKVTGIILEWSTEKVKVREHAGTIREFKIEQAKTKIEGRSERGAAVEVSYVSLQEGPLAMKVRVTAAPRTAVGVVKSWTRDKLVLEVDGKTMDFKIEGDWAKLQEGPLAKPIGKKVRVAYGEAGGTRTVAIIDGNF